MTLRDRIARLEKALEAILKAETLWTESLVFRSTASAFDASDPRTDVKTEDFIRRPPVVSALDEAELLSSECPSSPMSSTSSVEEYVPHQRINKRGTSFVVNAERPSYRDSTRSDSKDADICDTIRYALPAFDKLIREFESNGGWWTTFRLKCGVHVDGVSESLSEYAKSVYDSVRPTDVGKVAIALGRSSSANENVLALVDNLVLSNNNYAASTDGLDCFVLMAKCYIDIGQPKKAWLTCRRGIALAQLMV